MNNNIKKIVGMVAVEPRKCDTCPCEKTNCKKIDADGIGQFCLVSQENLEKLNAEAPTIDRLHDTSIPITERIKTFEDAMFYTGMTFPIDERTMALLGADVVAYMKLRVITAALNELSETTLDEFPKFTTDENRYYPWFWLYTKEEYDNMSEEDKGRCVLRSGHYTYAVFGFVSVYANYDASFSNTGVGSRLAFRTRELALYAGKQFIELWADFMFKPRTDEGLNGKSEAGIINFNGHE